MLDYLKAVPCRPLVSLFCYVTFGHPGPLHSLCLLERQMHGGGELPLRVESLLQGCENGSSIPTSSCGSHTKPVFPTETREPLRQGCCSQSRPCLSQECGQRLQGQPRVRESGAGKEVCVSWYLFGMQLASGRSCAAPSLTTLVCSPLSPVPHTSCCSTPLSRVPSTT